jgi:hypothetical protein
MLSRLCSRRRNSHTSASLSIATLNTQANAAAYCQKPRAAIAAPSSTRRIMSRLCTRSLSHLNHDRLARFVRLHIPDEEFKGRIILASNEIDVRIMFANSSTRCRNSFSPRCSPDDYNPVAVQITA